jgi:hypothetical protein
MTLASQAAVAMSFTECTACGVTFAMPSFMLKDRRETKQSFFCPNGHSLSYSESENDRLKSELVREKQRREIAESTARMEATRAQRAIAERDQIRKRMQHGVCPCCKRTFQNVARHMATKHPEHKNGG